MNIGSYQGLNEHGVVLFCKIIIIIIIIKNKEFSHIEFEVPCYYYLIFIFHMVKA